MKQMTNPSFLLNQEILFKTPITINPSANSWIISMCRPACAQYLAYPANFSVCRQQNVP